ncbi:MAG: tRNA pseudouridine(38-40) synthase TruA [Pseudomonadota bacterium]
MAAVLSNSTGHLSDQPLAEGQRLALRVEYDGSAFAGWQRQSAQQNVATVQETLEQALSQIASRPITVSCAGRTDAGVHAIAQWVHFDAPSERSLKAWLVGGNAHLPSTVRITASVPVAPDFHARFTAVSRTYDYLIGNSPVQSALLSNRVLWWRDRLDDQVMHAALQRILGERDFSAFRAASCQSLSPMRLMSEAAVRRQGDFLRVRLVANAFLHHMVRNIVGSLLVIGTGKASETWLEELLHTRDRTLAGATAPSCGLYLSDVSYPEHFSIPTTDALVYFPR